MPATYSYPGVYIEEIPSGVRTIVGVSTSDTAFIDFFPRGPLDQAVRITSFGDFVRIFGGLDPRSEASYAIQQYYLNGGSVAWVVRVAADAETAKRTLNDAATTPQAVLVVEAANPGRWGNKLEVGVDHNTGSSDLFNLAVREVQEVQGRRRIVNSEVFRNLSPNATHPDAAIEVINNRSTLIRLQAGSSPGLPAATGTNVLAKVSDVTDTTSFLKLGLGDTSANAAGSDGVEPGGTTQTWENTAAAEAILDPTNQQGGLYALDRIAPYLFNLLCIPATARLSNGSMQSVINEAVKFCRDHRAFFLVDIPSGVGLNAIDTWLEDRSITRDSHAAVYFPRLEMPDPLNSFRPREVGASGTVAGIYARTDATRGVWKAPAGIEASLRGVTLKTKLTDLENGGLNPLGINVLRNFPVYGNVVWGARTLEGADQQASEWKYVPVRRLASYLEESLYQGLKWVVFEPNDEPLWAQIRLNVGAFMQTLFQQGAFQGQSPREAYFVKCDRETTTQNDINLGIVNILVGFAPLKPAEFVVLQLQQMAGQIAT